MRSGGRFLAVALLCALTACGSATPSSSSTQGAAATPTSPTAPASASAPPATNAADPAHAVAPPGPRKDALHSADVLIFRPGSLPPAMVHRILTIRDPKCHGPCVRAHLQFGLAQAVVENQAVNLAAVDPASYRLWLPVQYADFQQGWDRVAGGEAAVTGKLFRKLTDYHGYLPTGSDPKAPRIHIGAKSAQIPQVDAVINDKWGQALGMRTDNALLLSTGINSPQAIRHRIKRIVGTQASVQLMDIATRIGLDPTATQAAILVGSTSSAVGTYTYTVLGGGHIAPSPAWVAAHISTETMPIIGPMTCNTAIFPQLRAALNEIAARGLASKIHPNEYAGCFYPRFIANTTTLSNHAFGLAFDINTPGNQRGTIGDIDRAVVAIFEKWGFTWGGNWHYTDPMHFEANRIIAPN